MQNTAGYLGELGDACEFRRDLGGDGSGLCRDGSESRKSARPVGGLDGGDELVYKMATWGLFGEGIGGYKYIIYCRGKVRRREGSENREGWMDGCARGVVTRDILPIFQQDVLDSPR